MGTAPSTIDKPKEAAKEQVLAPVASVSKEAEHLAWLASLDLMERVTVIRRNWGTTGIPGDKLDYLDNIAFIGGVARNVPWKLAKEWLVLHLVEPSHVFRNTASQSDFEEATGRTPMIPGSLAEALANMTPEKLRAILGNDKTKALALQLLNQVEAQH